MRMSRLCLYHYCISDAPKQAPSPFNTPRPRDLGRTGNAAIGELEVPAASKETRPVDPGGAANTQPRHLAWSLLKGLTGL